MIATQFSNARLAVAPASAKVASRASAVKVTALFKKKTESKPAVRASIYLWPMWVVRMRRAPMRVCTGRHWRRMAQSGTSFSL